MDPITTILVGLGVHAGSKAIDALGRWLSQGRHSDALHLSPDGVMERYAGGLRPELYGSPLVDVTIAFETGDPAVLQYVNEESPALLVIATPQRTGEPIVDVLPCSVVDSFLIELPAGEIGVGVLVFHADIVDQDGDPILVAWQTVETVAYSDTYLPIDIRLDAEFIGLLELDVGVPVCDWCLFFEEEATSSWRLTKKGNLKCNVCGNKNDFHECNRCESEQFRPTKKGNYRCLACDKKVVA